MLAKVTSRVERSADWFTVAVGDAARIGVSDLWVHSLFTGEKHPFDWCEFHIDWQRMLYIAAD